jgi:hypothetical protein
MQWSKSSREPNAQAAICNSAYLEYCGEEGVSEFVDIVEKIIEESHLRSCLSIEGCEG